MLCYRMFELVHDPHSDALSGQNCISFYYYNAVVVGTKGSCCVCLCVF